jgi:hypothetical protein
VWRVVPIGGEALHIKGAPAIALNEVNDFPCQSTTGNEQDIALASHVTEFVGRLEIDVAHDCCASSFHHGVFPQEQEIRDLGLSLLG